MSLILVIIIKKSVIVFAIRLFYQRDFIFNKRKGRI